MGEADLHHGPGITECPNPDCPEPLDVVAVAGGSEGEMECGACRCRFWIGEGKAYMPDLFGDEVGGARRAADS